MVFFFATASALPMSWEGHSFNACFFLGGMIIAPQKRYALNLRPTQSQSAPGLLHFLKFFIVGDPYKPSLSIVSGWGGRSKVCFL